MSDDGRGVARVAGKTVLVRGALPGETVSARYYRSHSRYDEAQAVAVDSASEQRVAPRCRHADECGGCALQHLDYDAQLRHKQHSVERLLAPLTDNDPERWLAPISLDPWHYRHRARLQLSTDKNGIELGFRRAVSHRVVPIDRCEVLAPALNALLAPLRELLATLPAARYIDEVLLHQDSDGLCAITLLSARTVTEAAQQQLEDFARSQGAAVLVARRRRDGAELAWQSANYRSLRYRIADGLVLQYQPLAFTQVNPAVNAELLALVREWLAPEPGQQLADYFCGIGNFALPLAADGAEVVGYELDAATVAAARDNAERNGIGNARFEQQDLLGGALPATATELAVLDPPRVGARELCTSLAAGRTQRLVYVSCNPATFARDAGILCAGGFTLARLQLLDMFPHTPHSEVAGLFIRR